MVPSGSPWAWSETHEVPSQDQEAPCSWGVTTHWHRLPVVVELLLRGIPKLFGHGPGQFTLGGRSQSMIL